jgi:transcription antitermination factor NusG
MGGWCKDRYNKDENNKHEGLHQKPDQIEENRWEGQNFSEVVAPQKKKKKKKKKRKKKKEKKDMVLYSYMYLGVHQNADTPATVRIPTAYTAGVSSASKWTWLQCCWLRTRHDKIKL